MNKFAAAFFMIICLSALPVFGQIEFQGISATVAASSKLNKFNEPPQTSIGLSARFALPKKLSLNGRVLFPVNAPDKTPVFGVTISRCFLFCK